MSLAQEEEEEVSGGRDPENEDEVDTEEEMLQRAMAMSLAPPEEAASGERDP